MLGAEGQRSRWRRPTRALVVVALLVAGLFVLGGCVADPPPLIGTAVPGDGGATVSWQPPLAAPMPIVAYVVTPWIGQVAQTPTRFNSTATTETVVGLTNGTTYRFTVVAINSLGNDSASSASSNAVTPGFSFVKGVELEPPLPTGSNRPSLHGGRRRAAGLGGQRVRSRHGQVLRRPPSARHQRHLDQSLVCHVHRLQRRRHDVRRGEAIHHRGRPVHPQPDLLPPGRRHVEPGGEARHHRLLGSRRNRQLARHLEEQRHDEGPCVRSIPRQPLQVVSQHCLDEWQRLPDVVHRSGRRRGIGSGRRHTGRGGYPPANG